MLRHIIFIYHMYVITTPQQDHQQHTTLLFQQHHTHTYSAMTMFFHSAQRSHHSTHTRTQCLLRMECTTTIMSYIHCECASMTHSHVSLSINYVEITDIYINNA